MKRDVFRTLTAFGIIALLSIPAAYAQSGERLRVKIPFDFVVQDRTLAAGDYMLEQGSEPIMLQIKSVRDPGVVVRVVTDSVATNHVSRNSRLIFHKYGSQYFLKEVWQAAAGHGRQIPPSAAEREVAKHSSQGEPQTVTLNVR